ncbi:hypothetical protein K435DRAFT_873297 [Dendrothele bispora CBS 962.96]|uniref:Uncharacterized protein n=1 Tax=Dendrothele bispora (strain CBS 962.96) TaxID=1314807 RepID=A0A4S8KZQ8_DENBC|nr:hypothetical protein K435DRAFT_873297 [Dendrothele bispora CBS 962.96]
MTVLRSSLCLRLPRYLLRLLVQKYGACSYVAAHCDVLYLAIFLVIGSVAPLLHHPRMLNSTEGLEELEDVEGHAIDAERKDQHLVTFFFPGTFLYSPITPPLSLNGVSGTPDAT